MYWVAVQNEVFSTDSGRWCVAPRGAAEPSAPMRPQKTEAAPGFLRERLLPCCFICSRGTRGTAIAQLRKARTALGDPLAMASATPSSSLDRSTSHRQETLQPGRGCGVPPPKTHVLTRSLTSTNASARTRRRATWRYLGRLPSTGWPARAAARGGELRASPDAVLAYQDSYGPKGTTAHPDAVFTTSAGRPTP